MTLATDYDKLCPIFNWNTKDGGVLFPFTIHPLALDYVDFDGADLSAILGSFVAPFKCRLITAQVTAVNDANGAKAGAATAEPVIGIVYGTNTPLATSEVGTSCGVITCDGAGAVGKVWGGTTDATTITEGQEVAVYLKTAGAATDTTMQDGGGVVTLWFAHANSPA